MAKPGILAEKSPLTVELARCPGRFCGNGPGLWLRLQQQVALWEAERALGRVLAKISPAKASWPRCQPIRDPD